MYAPLGRYLRSVCSLLIPLSISASLSTSSCSDDKVKDKRRSVIHYRNETDVNRKIAKIRSEGTKSLKVISDFDFTLTKFRMDDGRRGASCHRVLEDCGLLSADYHTSAQSLQRVYYPLEILPSLGYEARVRYMVEWVTKAHDVLVRSGISQKQVKLAVRQGVRDRTIQLRDGVVPLIHYLSTCGVPLIIFSAGIADVLVEVVKVSAAIDTLPRNTKVVSNRCIFDNGILSGFDSPIYHVFNKRGDSFKDEKYFSEYNLENRPNMVLLGDSLGDLSMAEGLYRDGDTVLTIGFLNDREERLKEYLIAYDIVILGDPGINVLDKLKLFEECIMSDEQ
jgi:cytosolic 5'-nucleotidase 3